MSSNTNLTIAAKTVTSFPLSVGIIKYMTRILPEESRKRLHKKIDKKMEEVEQNYKHYYFQESFKISLFFGVICFVTGGGVTLMLNQLNIVDSRFTKGFLVVSTLHALMQTAFITSLSFITTVIFPDEKLKQSYRNIRDAHERFEARDREITRKKEEKEQEIARRKAECINWRKQLKYYYTHDNETMQMLLFLNENYYLTKEPNAVKCSDDLRCPISRMPMRNPVIAGDGITYDLYSLVDWYITGNSVCPHNPAVTLICPFELKLNKEIAIKIYDTINSQGLGITFQKYIKDMYNKDPNYKYYA